ncbi:hypothetical protein ABVK25_004185 [Lepraria finkii]|uniref:Uncharacterized protein n=1 Tax=Lepraria finkii TaxID=1340010 RepID=A0ABR4BBY9_9LECA
MTKLLLRLCNLHALKRAKRTQSDLHSLLSHSSNNSLCVLNAESASLLHAPAPAIIALIDDILRELIDQISIRTMDLHAIKARLNRVLSSLLIIPNEAQISSSSSGLDASPPAAIDERLLLANHLSPASFLTICGFAVRPRAHS